MKANAILASLALTAALTLLAGCESTPSQSGNRSAVATADVEVFRDGAEPAKPFKEIGVLKDDGKEAEQEEIEKKLIKKAKQMGGDAILFDKPKQSGMEMDFFSFGASKFTYLYRARVVVYQ